MNDWASENLLSSWHNDVRFIGLCGVPRCGKSTVAEMLADEFSGVIIDDALILRQAVPILFGIDISEPFTQEGKAKEYFVCGRRMTVREMLGELGEFLESRYSPDLKTMRAVNYALKAYPSAPFYILPSLRLDQGLFLKTLGGVVIEVVNPRVQPTGNGFDEYNKSFVDFQIINDTSLEDLREFVKAVPELISALSE